MESRQLGIGDRKAPAYTAPSKAEICPGNGTPFPTKLLIEGLAGRLINPFAVSRRRRNVTHARGEGGGTGGQSVSFAYALIPRLQRAESHGAQRMKERKIRQVAR